VAVLWHLPDCSYFKRGYFLHYAFVSTLLNDLFGVQTRGGCSCAGPYAERMLGVKDGPAVGLTTLLNAAAITHRGCLLHLISAGELVRGTAAGNNHQQARIFEIQYQLLLRYARSAVHSERCSLCRAPWYEIALWKNTFVHNPLNLTLIIAHLHACCPRLEVFAKVPFQLEYLRMASHGERSSATVAQRRCVQGNALVAVFALRILAHNATGNAISYRVRISPSPNVQRNQSMGTSKSLFCR